MSSPQYNQVPSHQPHSGQIYHGYCVLVCFVQVTPEGEAAHHYEEVLEYGLRSYYTCGEVTKAVIHDIAQSGLLSIALIIPYQTAKHEAVQIQLVNTKVLNMYHQLINKVLSID